MTPQAEWFAEEKRTHSIIGTFYYVYNQLGFGFLESVYALALALVLERRGHKVAREVMVPIHFEGRILQYQRVDLVVDDVIIVEIKSTATLHPRAQRQLFNCLKATGLEVGLLFHFGHEPKFYRLACKNDRLNRPDR